MSAVTSELQKVGCTSPSSERIRATTTSTTIVPKQYDVSALNEFLASRFAGSSYSYGTPDTSLYDAVAATYQNAAEDICLRLARGEIEESIRCMITESETELSTQDVNLYVDTMIEAATTVVCSGS